MPVNPVFQISEGDRRHPPTRPAPDWRAPIDIRGLFSQMAGAFRTWQERARQWDEIAELERSGQLEPTLAELGISYGQLKVFMRAHPRAVQLRAGMMRWLGVDQKQAALARESRDIEWRCLQCSAWRDCRDWLASNELGRPLPTFCPNMDTFNRLLAVQYRSGTKKLDRTGTAAAA